MNINVKLNKLMKLLVKNDDYELDETVEETG